MESFGVSGHGLKHEEISHQGGLSWRRLLYYQTDICLIFCSIQVSLVKQDFEAERSDRERMASELSDLVGKLETQKQEFTEEVSITHLWSEVSTVWSTYIFTSELRVYNLISWCSKTCNYLYNLNLVVVYQQHFYYILVVSFGRDMW